MWGNSKSAPIHSARSCNIDHLLANGRMLHDCHIGGLLVRGVKRLQRLLSSSGQGVATKRRLKYS